MLKLVIFAAILCVCAAQNAGDIDNGPGAVGDVVFSWKFNTNNSTDTWSNAGVASIVEGGYLGQKALLIQNAGTTVRTTKMITKQIDNVNLARNTTVKVSARVKAIDVSSSSVSWDGIKIALKIGKFEGLFGVTPVYTYPQKTKVWGTFDWSNTAADFTTALNGDVSSLVIQVGLGNATGTLLVDSVNVTITASVPSVTSAELANLEFFGCDDPFGGSACSLSGGVPNGKTLPNSWQVKIGANGAAAECSVSYFPNSVSGFCDTTLPLFSGSYPVYARLSPSSPWVQTKTTVNYQRQFAPNYEGCYPDSLTNRDLPVQGPNVGNQMYDRCADWCGLRGYTYAGLQSSSECWCGNNRGQRGAKLNDNQCNSTCTGDARYLCGGAVKNSVYRATDRTQYDYQGCYVDSTQNRDLPVQKTIAGGVDVFKCRLACAGPYNPQTGIPQYTYAAVQNGNQCFCGNEFGNYGAASASECNKPCVADPTFNCGGASRNAVWTASYNTEPYDYLG